MTERAKSRIHVSRASTRPRNGILHVLWTGKRGPLHALLYFGDENKRLRWDRNLWSTTKVEAKSKRRNNRESKIKERQRMCTRFAFVLTFMRDREEKQRGDSTYRQMLPYLVSATPRNAVFGGE